MKLTKAQRELLHQWHRLDQAAGCRQWHTPLARQLSRSIELRQSGLLTHQLVGIQSMPVYMLTDEAVRLIEKGGE